MSIQKTIAINRIFKQSFLIIAMFIAMITLFSCNTLKKPIIVSTEVTYSQDTITAATKGQITDSVPKMEYSNFTNLYEYPYQWLSYRAKVDYTFEGNLGTCNLYFVNRIDSLIYLNINISGIEVVRLVFTPKQVTYVNKLNKTYYQGNYFFIERIAKVPLNFYTIQSLFNGKDFANYEQNFTITDCKDSIILYSPKREDLKNGNTIKQTLILDPMFHIINNLIEVEYISKNLSIQYLQYAPITEYTLFNSMIINSLDFNFNLDLKNIRFNTPGPTSITIPESFTPINFQPKL